MALKKSELYSSLVAFARSPSTQDSSPMPGIFWPRNCSCLMKLKVRQALPCVPPAATASLQSLHRAKNYKGMVQLIKKSMNIEGITIRVLWVPDGAANEGVEKDAPAWIRLLPTMPAYGTEAFREMTLTMCVRKSFLRQSSYDEVTILVAHELSHVVLESIAHPLREVEQVVDLTAMMLGFRLLYKTACYKEWYSGNTIRHQKLGYLTPAEVNKANEVLSGQNRVRCTESRARFA
jgi:hypothetical protein